MNCYFMWVVFARVFLSAPNITDTCMPVVSCLLLRVLELAVRIF